MYDVRKQYRPPTRVWVAAALLGVVTLVGGLVLSSLLSQEIKERISAGKVVVGQVTSVQVIPVGKYSPPVRIEVRYAYLGVYREADLFDDFPTDRYAVGQEVELFVDPDDPTKLATRDGLASNGFLVIAPGGMIGLGLFGTVASPIAAWRWWRRYWGFTPRPVRGLAVDVILGEDHLMTPWGRSAKSAAEEIRRAGATVYSPLRLWMVFLAEGEGIRPGFVGVRRAAFFTRQRRLVLEAVLPQELDVRAVRQRMLELLNQGIAEAEDLARSRQLATQLDALRTVQESLSVGGSPGSSGGSPEG
ncbi:DUF3592 domain-containing protein [Micromonospora sicca]|uniref:DUF3592 domain-containing protein n=1 Tax=Micromonospora sicca TaxID=2202420 RepID=UPI001374E8FD|nr:DUF3592 domain-containing protein [Micromonospora sp. 4G51]